mmetsp:Transcript_7368/g.15957  ORF Transcript_7368/g.15957 Transcript_7368/m.15957 type:complete len:243 (-) Transcript_7368:268-996(-)
MVRGHGGTGGREARNPRPRPALKQIQFARAGRRRRQTPSENRKGRRRTAAKKTEGGGGGGGRGGTARAAIRTVRRRGRRCVAARRNGRSAVQSDRQSARAAQPLAEEGHFGPEEPWRPRSRASALSLSGAPCQCWKHRANVRKRYCATHSVRIPDCCPKSNSCQKNFMGFYQLLQPSYILGGRFWKPQHRHQCCFQNGMVSARKPVCAYFLSIFKERKRQSSVHALFQVDVYQVGSVVQSIL